MRCKAGCLACFPYHLRDFDLIGSSVKMKERTSGDSHMDQASGSQGEPEGAVESGEMKQATKFVYIAADLGPAEWPGCFPISQSVTLCTQACVVSPCMFDSRKVCMYRNVAVLGAYMPVHGAG